MLRHFTISFTQKESADNFILVDLDKQHEHEDELITVWRRRKDARRNRINCQGCMAELQTTDYEKVKLVVSMYSHSRIEFEDKSSMLYVHPRHFVSIRDLMLELGENK
jgi:hypothetical protein